MRNVLFAFTLLFAVACARSEAGHSTGTPTDPTPGTPTPTPGPGPSIDPGTPATPTLQAGAAVADITPEVGAPLAGFSGRRLKTPDINPLNDITFFEASTGVRDALHVKVIVLDDGHTRVALMATDSIAMLGGIVDLIAQKAAAKGSTIDEDHLMAFAAHSHSSSGALTDRQFWEIAAADLEVDHLRDAMAEACATALVAAEGALAPAVIGVNRVEVLGATRNRRAGVSLTFTADSIDPDLFVIRVDRPDGTAVATLWNFAIHGTALPATNLALSADVMGGISAFVEAATSAPALFANSAEGDISPNQSGDAGITALGQIVGQKIIDGRAATTTTGVVTLANDSQVIDFGAAAIQINGTSLKGQTGDIDLSIIAPLGIGTSVNLDDSMIDHSFRFQAIRINDDVLASAPGEPIHTLGYAIKDAGHALGFNNVMVVGLANGHMSYITDAAEYQAGGYEALSTFFGPDTGVRLVAAITDRMTAVKP